MFSTLINIFNWVFGRRKIVCESADWICRNTDGAQSVRDYMPKAVAGIAMPVMNYVVDNYIPITTTAIAITASTVMLFAYNSPSQSKNNLKLKQKTNETADVTPYKGDGTRKNPIIIN